MNVNTKTTTKTKVVEDVSVAKNALLKTRQAARDRVCVGPRHPGNPTDYRYVLRESCELLDRNNSPVKPRTPKSRVSIAQTKKEIKMLEHVLRTQYSNTDTGNAMVSYQTTLSAFEIMADSKSRLDCPDPEERYLKIMVSLKRRKLTGKQSRYRVMAMLLAHLKILALG